MPQLGASCAFGYFSPESATSRPSHACTQDTATAGAGSAPTASSLWDVLPAATGASPTSL